MSVATNEAISTAIGLCKVFEGLRLRPYIRPAGYPTLGYGTVNKPDGTKVSMSDSAISKEVAESWLVHELELVYMPGVLKASPVLLQYPKALGAIADFAYNLGVPRYRASTLRQRVNLQDWIGAKEQLMLWTRGAGKVLPGLVARRKAESLLLP